MKRVVLSAVLLGVFAQGQAASLAEMYQAARSYDSALKSAEAAYQAATEKIPQAWAGLKPKLNVSSNRMHNNEQLSAGFGVPETYAGTTKDTTVSLTQPIYHADTLFQLNESYLAVDQAKAQLEYARQDLMLRTVQAYFNVLLAQDAINSLVAQKEAVAQQLKSARRGFELGNNTVTDVNEALAKYALVLSQQINANNQLDAANRALVSITGMTAEELNGLDGKNTSLGLTSGDINQWTAAAMRQSQRIRVQQDAVKTAEQEIWRNRATAFPTIDLVASDSHTGGQQMPLSPTRNKAAGVQLNWPLYQGGLVMSRTREAMANRLKSLNDLEQARREVSLQTQQAFLAVRSGAAQVAALEQAMKAVASNLKSTRLAKMVGIRNSVDLLNAQQTYFDTVKSLNDARYNLLVSEFKLLAAAGALGEQDIRRANTLLTQPVKLMPTVMDAPSPPITGPLAK